MVSKIRNFLNVVWSIFRYVGAHLSYFYLVFTTLFIVLTEFKLDLHVNLNFHDVVLKQNSFPKSARSADS